MRAALTTPIVLPHANLTNVVGDLFAHDEIPLPSLRKRPYIDEPEVGRLEVGLTEEQQFELTRLC